MLGAFVVISLGFIEGGAHQETTRRDLHEVESQRIGQFDDSTEGEVGMSHGGSGGLVLPDCWELLGPV
jgi:hypothetical protein